MRATLNAPTFRVDPPGGQAFWRDALFIKNLFRDEQRKVLNQILAATREEIHNTTICSPTDTRPSRAFWRTSGCRR